VLRGSRRLVVLAALIAAGLTVLGLGSLALAAKHHEVTIRDAKGDAKPDHADIRVAGFVQEAKTDVWTVTAYGEFTTHQAPCVVVKSTHPAGARWTVCGKGEGTAPPCSMSVSLASPFPRGGGCAGDDHSSRPSQKTIVYHVPRKTFSGLKPSPKGITWSIQVLDYPDCAYPKQACDSAPAGRSIAAKP
jgi:hypothetical protein